MRICLQVRHVRNPPSASRLHVARLHFMVEIVESISIAFPFPYGPGGMGESKLAQNISSTVLATALMNKNPKGGPVASS